jgi:3',5'-cyclic-AMP phosphodiesterase
MKRLCGAVREAGANAVLLGSDLAEAPDVADVLEGLDARFGLPLCFVLSNHDFYRGSIARVRAAVRALCARSPRLRWLLHVGVAPRVVRWRW